MFMFEVGIGVALIILASAIGKYITARTRSAVPGDTEQRLMARMDELDKRLTEIQDVMIAIDERMSRSNPGG